MWTTRDPVDSVVYVGTQPGIYTSTFTGSSPQTYTIDDMCDRPANEKKNWRDPGYFHDVVLTGLQPSTRYYYKYGSAANISMTAEQSFVSSPGELRRTSPRDLKLTRVFQESAPTSPFDSLPTEISVCSCHSTASSSNKSRAFRLPSGFCAI